MIAGRSLNLKTRWSMSARWNQILQQLVMLATGRIQTPSTRAGENACQILTHVWLSLFCGNHGNRISERLVVELDPEQSMSKLTGFIGLLRNSTLLLRLITMVTPAIIDLIVLAPEARAPEGAGAHHLKFRLPLTPPTLPRPTYLLGGLPPPRTHPICALACPWIVHDYR